MFHIISYNSNTHDFTQLGMKETIHKGVHIHRKPFTKKTINKEDHSQKRRYRSSNSNLALTLLQLYHHRNSDTTATPTLMQFTLVGKCHLYMSGIESSFVDSCCRRNRLKPDTIMTNCRSLLNPFFQLHTPYPAVQQQSALQFSSPLSMIKVSVYLDQNL